MTSFWKAITPSSCRHQLEAVYSTGGTALTPRAGQFLVNHVRDGDFAEQVAEQRKLIGAGQRDQRATVAYHLV